ncbi:MAG: type II secretion system protein GspM [Ghiorsea sp.]|nr:type II secretion system protein GspM [Ghiorsea sp.]
MRLFHHNLEKLNLLWQERFAPRYDALAESEQRILNIAAITLPLILFIFGIVLPILDKNTALQQDISNLSAQVLEANQLADQLEKQPKTMGATNTSLLSQVDSLARQSDVRQFMTRLRPQPVIGGKKQLQTQIKNAPYKAIAVFISKLEMSGLNITRIKIQAVTAGIVNVQATIGQ